IATDRLGSVGQKLASLPKYWKAKKIIWKYVSILTIISLISAFIGANVLLRIDKKVLQNLVGILLFILLPLIFVKREIGTIKKSTSKIKKFLGLILFSILMTFAAFFGGGVGPLIYYVLMFFLGLTIIEANATMNIPYFLLALFSLIIFALNGIIDYRNGIVLFTGMAIGGYIGAHVALTKGNLWVKRLFAVVVILSGIKLLFF
ncbi:hypothetical protein COY95_02460, partial [Candidatus Woesearchaeota archaeon CG_4_10_14_0_8_um_filter_47_5]